MHNPNHSETVVQVPVHQEDIAEYKKWVALTLSFDKAQQEMSTDDHLPFSSNFSPQVEKTWNSKPSDGNERVIDKWQGYQNEAKKSV
jgi:hypothetical protein